MKQKAREEELKKYIRDKLKDCDVKEYWERKAELKGIQEGKAEADFEIKALKTSLKEANENCKGWITAYNNEVNLRKQERKRILGIVDDEYTKARKSGNMVLHAFYKIIKQKIKE